jgi:hypothetical protein
MFRYLVLMALIVSGCSSPHELAKCHGPLVVLNTDHWRPTATDVAALAQICPEDK